MKITYSLSIDKILYEQVIIYYIFLSELNIRTGKSVLN
jgi:hypothetical protein